MEVRIFFNIFLDGGENSIYFLNKNMRTTFSQATSQGDASTTSQDQEVDRTTLATCHGVPKYVHLLFPGKKKG